MQSLLAPLKVFSIYCNTWQGNRKKRMYNNQADDIGVYHCKQGVYWLKGTAHMSKESAFQIWTGIGLFSHIQC